MQRNGLGKYYCKKATDFDLSADQLPQNRKSYPHP